VGVGLNDQGVGLGLEGLDGGEAERGIVEAGKRHDRFGELGGIAWLFAAHAAPGGHGLLGAFGVVFDGGLGVRGGVAREQLGAEETGLHHGVRMPKEAISGASDSLHPSTPNFAAAYAVQNIPPAMPAVEEMVSNRPERCWRIAGSTARVTFIGPNNGVSIWLRTCSGLSSSKKPA
jgi:hypothetical protein